MSSTFSSWKVGAPYYTPVLIVSILVQWAVWGTSYPYASAPFWLLTLFTLNFFRDPPRTISTNSDEIVSPADGVIDGIDDLDESPYYEGPCTRIAIFLNVFNVHINRAPDDCTVLRIEHKDGQYRNALDPTSSQVNECNMLYLETPHGKMTVRQISGAIARRIVCVTSGGKQLTKGEKFGMIKFGSRTELFLPQNLEILAGLKDKVNGGSTVIAKFDRSQSVNSETEQHEEK